MAKQLFIRMANQNADSNYYPENDLSADELSEAWEKAMEDYRCHYPPGWLGELIDQLRDPNGPDVVETPEYTAWFEEGDGPIQWL
jgi:hypothetical protein